MGKRELYREGKGDLQRRGKGIKMNPRGAVSLAQDGDSSPRWEGQDQENTIEKVDSPPPF